MYYVYVLKSLRTGQFYVGSTNSLKRRLDEHNSSYSFYTKNKGPWQLVYSEEKRTLKAAKRREKFLKTGDGRRTLKNISNKY